MMRDGVKTTGGTLRIGPLAIEWVTGERELAHCMVRRYASFLVDGPGDLRLELRALGPVGDGEERGGSPYRPRSAIDGSILTMRSPVVDARVDLEAGEGFLAVDPDPLAAEYFIENALRQIVQTVAVARGSFLLHAAGIEHPGTGGALVFAGRSGAGKSTISALLRAAGAHVLSDDLVLVDAACERPDSACERPRLVATPFFGTLAPQGVSPGSIPIDSIDFLEQAPHPERIEVQDVPDRAASLLGNAPFASCFDRAHREILMDAIVRTVTAVPTARLRFRPDRSVLPLLDWPAEDAVKVSVAEEATR